MLPLSTAISLCIEEASAAAGAGAHSSSALRKCDAKYSEALKRKLSAALDCVLGPGGHVPHQL